MGTNINRTSRIRAEIQDCFADYIQLRGRNGNELIFRLADIINFRQFDILCYKYEEGIDAYDISAYDCDSKFSRILQKNINRLLTLTGYEVPSKNSLCPLLERSLEEVIRWQRQ